MLKAQPETRNHVLVCLKTIFCPCNFPILPKWSNSSSDFEDFSQVARQKTDTSTVHQLPNIIITLKWFSFRASQGEPSYCGAWVTACAAKVSILLVRASADWWGKVLMWCYNLIFKDANVVFWEIYPKPPINMEVKNGSIWKSNRSYLSNTALFHFHVYGRKSITS